MCPSHDSVTVSRHAQDQEPETEAAKWNSVIIILLFTPVLFRPRHVKMSSVKKAPRLRFKTVTALVFPTFTAA